MSILSTKRPYNTTPLLQSLLEALVRLCGWHLQSLDRRYSAIKQTFSQVILLANMTIINHLFQKRFGTDGSFTNSSSFPSKVGSGRINLIQLRTIIIVSSK